MIFIQFRMEFLLRGLLIFIICVPPTIGLRCWSHFRGFRIQQCPADQTSCVASYIPVSGNENTGNGTTLARTADGVLVSLLYISCSPAAGGLCLEPTCDFEVSAGNINTCCCRGDLCNSIPGITPDTSSTVPGPTGTIPTERHGYVACEVYNCTNADGTKAVDCYHGYQSCPTNTAPFQHREVCQATYRRTPKNLYELYRKGCQSITSLLCDNRTACFVDTESGEPFINCCCDSRLCNVNVTASNPTLFDGARVDECAEVGCAHSCILHNDVPTCLCSAGYILAPDGKSCEDIDECASPSTHPCEDICVNSVGGFHCECSLGTQLQADQHSCSETGLSCQSLTCRNNGCAGQSIQYCDDFFTGSVSHCQATFRLMEDGSLDPRLQSCYNAVDSSCSDNECVLRPLSHSPDLYFCCCNGHLCNDRIVFPNRSAITPSLSINHIPVTASHDGSVSSTSSVPIPSGVVVLGQLLADENCTSVFELPRIGCAAESCLVCGNANAECVHNETSNTVTCIADTSACSVELCPQCNYCFGAYIQPSGNSSFSHHSLCVPMTMHETCEEAELSKRCVINRNVSSVSDIFVPVTAWDGALAYHCGCYGENCTEHLLYSYSVTVLPQPSAIVLGSVTMKTTTLISFLVTPTPELETGDGTHPTALPSQYIITIAVAILAILLILFIALGIIQAKKRLARLQRQGLECMEVQQDYDKNIE